MVNNLVIIVYGTDGNHTDCSKHWVMYRNVKLLCYTPETNIACWLYFNNKKIEK